MDATDAPQIVEHIHHSLDFTPFGCCWIPNTAKICVFGETPKCKGICVIYEMSNGKLNTVGSLAAPFGFKSAAVSKFDVGGTSIALGQLDGTVSLYSFNNLGHAKWTAHTHRLAVNTIDSCGNEDAEYGPPEILTGSRDGSVRLWDARLGHEVLSLQAAEGEVSAECWSVAFGNAYTKLERSIAAGFDNGDIKLFDLRKNSIMYDENLQNGICHIQFDRKDIRMNKLACATLEGYLYMFDLRTLHGTEGYAKKKYKVQPATIWGCQFLPQNREICAVTSGNGQVSLYKYSYPAERAIKDPMTNEQKGVVGTIDLLNDKNLSSQPIVGFDWHTDKLGLGAIVCLDQTVRVLFVTKLQKC